MQTPVASIIMFIVAAFLGALGAIPLQGGCRPYERDVDQLLLNPLLLGGVACYIAVMVGHRIGRDHRRGNLDCLAAPRADCPQAEGVQTMIGWWTTDRQWQHVWERWFSCRHALDHPLVVTVVIGAIVVSIVAGVVIQLLRRSGRISPDLYRDLYLRWRSWIVIAVLVLAPILLGAAWTMLAVFLLSLACYYEFDGRLACTARSTST